jgi:Family of unknown function (DUF6062)
MREKFVGYFRLVEACAQPGCPVCRCLVAESRSYLNALLYEQVTDPETRRALRQSWGFCNWHTWMLPEIEGSAFGAAILGEDLVTRAVRRTQRLRGGSPVGAAGRWLAALVGRRWRPSLVEGHELRAPCPGCVHTGQTQARYLEALADFIDDEVLSAAYARSDGLCVPHVVLAVERGSEPARVETLVARTREAWARIGRDLASFIGKHDHRNREPYTEAEVAARARALKMLAGARGVFGIDPRASPGHPG